MGNIIHGIDVSRYQEGPNDFRAARRAGMAWGVQRWGIGVGSRDSTRYRHLEGIIAAGMVPGAYLVVAERENGALQGRRFVEDVWRHFGTDQPMLFVIDAEISRSFGSPSFDTVYATVSTVRALTDRPPICYIPRWYMQDRRWGQAHIDRLHQFPWWQSRYVKNPDFAKGPGTFAGWKPTFWQWTSTMNVPGIPGHCDANVFYGDMSELRALAGERAHPIPQQEIPRMFTFGSSGRPTFFVEGGRAAGLNERTDHLTLQEECKRAGAPLPHFPLDAETYDEFVKRFRDHR